MKTAAVSLAAIRRHAVSTQGYAPRFRRARAGEVEDTIRRLGAVQLDSISAVDRAHRLTLSSRIGAYPEKELQQLLVSGRVFEYWAHEACLLPIELWPHCRRTMEGGAHWRFHEPWRLKGGRARLRHHVLALVDEGLLREVAADDGGPPFYVDGEAELDGDPSPPVLLCPFDNLLWDRPLLERFFDFHHVIEVYKPERERAYGYYVLPLLAGDRILGRADLKADRAEGVLRVRRFHPEPRVRGNVTAKLERAAARLARVLGLEEVRHA